jgi:mono/diheme cytochrome c family protein
MQAASPSGNILLNNYANVKIQATNGRLVGAVSHAAGYSAMPKNANKLTECQIAQIRKWVNAGALNN